MGWYISQNVVTGFRLESDGTLRYPIEVAPHISTMLQGANEMRAIVGQVPEGDNTAGAYYTGRHTFQTYDFPGLSYNLFTGINGRGLICGAGLEVTTQIFYSYLVQTQRGH